MIGVGEKGGAQRQALPFEGQLYTRQGLPGIRLGLAAGRDAAGLGAAIDLDNRRIQQLFCPSRIAVGQRGARGKYSL